MLNKLDGLACFLVGVAVAVGVGVLVAPPGVWVGVGVFVALPLESRLSSNQLMLIHWVLSLTR